MCSRAHTPQQNKPPKWESRTPQLESSPHFPRLEKSLCGNEDPAQPKTNKKEQYIKRIAYHDLVRLSKECKDSSTLETVTSIPHFILLNFTALSNYCIFFSQIEGLCGNLVLHESIGTIFPTASAYFMSLYHILIINTSNFFSIIVFVMVIFEQWSLMLLQQKDCNSLKAQVMVSIF